MISPPLSCSINCGGCLGIGGSSRGNIDVSSDGGTGGRYSWISGKAATVKIIVKGKISSPEKISLLFPDETFLFA